MSPSKRVKTLTDKEKNVEKGTIQLNPIEMTEALKETETTSKRVKTSDDKETNVEIKTTQLNPLEMMEALKETETTSKRVKTSDDKETNVEIKTTQLNSLEMTEALKETETTSKRVKTSDDKETNVEIKTTQLNPLEMTEALKETETTSKRVKTSDDKETNVEIKTTQLNPIEMMEALKETETTSKRVKTSDDKETNVEIKTTQLNPKEAMEALKENRKKCINEMEKILSPEKDCVAKVKQFIKFKEIKVKSPTKANDNKKESLNAFVRFSYLVDKPEENQSLVLPQKFKVLAKAFQCTDIIVSMLYKRQEICTFNKIMQSVETMMGKNFDFKRLAQIQTVWSDAFQLKYELNRNNLDNNKSETKYQLTLTPIYNSYIKLSSSNLLERYQSFVNKLFDITKEYHNNYINNLGVNIEGSELCRWHPQFKLDEVPDIVPNYNAIPVEPKSNQKSAETYLQSFRQKFSLSTTDKIEKTNNNDNQIDSKTASEKIKKGVLKGISMDFLNKIRAKEAANLAQEMTRKPEVEKEIMVLKRLPELIGIIKSYFNSEKKPAIPFDDVIKKIIDSYHCSLSILDARDHVNYMSKLLPDWIYVLEVKRGSYIKINKETSLSILEKRITEKVNSLMKNLVITK